MPFSAELVRGDTMPEKFNELLLKPDIIELYDNGITPNFGYLLNGRFEKDMVRTLIPKGTLSGNPITWTADETEYLFPTVSLEPKQAGTGDPSPENVRPITGWDNVRVHQRGLNLLDFSKIAFYPSDVGAGTVSVDYVKQTITIAANVNNVGYYQTLRDIVGEDLPPGTYVLDAETSNVNAQRIIYMLDTGRVINFGTPTLITDVDLNSKFSWYNNVNAPEPNTISNIRFCMAPTPYVPYQGNDYTLTLPETIYGGTVDAVTGEGSNLYLFKELAIADMNHVDNYPGWVNQDWVTQVVPGEIKNTTLSALGCEGVTNITPTLNFRITPYFVLYLAPGNDVFPGLTQSQIKEQYPELVVQFCLKLVTPEPFQATGNRQLTSLVGYNTMYSNGISITLKRKVRRLEV